MKRHFNTENEFVNYEITRIGFDEVERLMDLGFEPKLTSEGWAWIQTPLIPTPARTRHSNYSKRSLVLA